jgi:GDP-D-mannose 3', 5'-epimerase
MTKLAVVMGAGGFIGGHLCKRLLHDGYIVRAVDIKPMNEWFQTHYTPTYVFHGLADVGRASTAETMTEGADEVYNLAADMGGMGFITGHKLDCMLSVRASTEVLMACVKNGVPRYFYSSSACVYPDYRQNELDILPLAEQDAYPAMPEDGYGWEKLFSERMARHVRDESDVETRIARYHNSYGAHGSWDGGREKAPAALMRKVAIAQITDSKYVQIWGDGLAKRSYMHVDDCVEGTLRVMRGEYTEPLNVGSDETVSVYQLLQTICDVAGHQVTAISTDGPQGVRARTSDNTLIKKIYDWSPQISLAEGIAKTYPWIYDQVRSALRCNS